MSRRFGRNQKRRMREALAQADHDAERFKEAYQAENALVKMQRSKIEYLETVLYDVQRVLENNSSALPPESVETQGWNMDEILVPDLPLMPLIYSDGTAKTKPFSIERLKILTANVNTDPFRTGKHVFVQFDGLRWGYALNREAIRRMPVHLLEKRVFGALSELISKELKEAICPHQTVNC